MNLEKLLTEKSTFWQSNVRYYQQYSVPLTEDELTLLDTISTNKDSSAAFDWIQKCGVDTFKKKSEQYQSYKSQQILSKEVFEKVEKWIQHDDVKSILTSNLNLKDIIRYTQYYQAYYIKKKISYNELIVNVSFFVDHITKDITTNLNSREMPKLLTMIDNMHLPLKDRLRIVEWANTQKIPEEMLRLSLFNGCTHVLSRHGRTLFNYIVRYTDFDKEEFNRNVHVLRFLQTDFMHESLSNQKSCINMLINVVKKQADDVEQWGRHIWKNDPVYMKSVFSHNLCSFLHTYDLWTPELLKVEYPIVLKILMDSSNSVNIKPIKRCFVQNPEEKIPFLLYAIQQRKLHAMCQFQKDEHGHTMTKNRYFMMSLEALAQCPEVALAMYVYGCCDLKYFALFAQHKHSTRQQLEEIQNKVEMLLNQTYGVDPQSFMQVMSGLYGTKQSDKHVIFDTLRKQTNRSLEETLLML